MAHLHLFDTRHRELRPIHAQAETFGFYCCGPTVYGPAHIGNFRTFVAQDLFRRVLELSGTPTLHVRNLTDVDDKTIKGAMSEGITLDEFTGRWTQKFHQDCESLGLLQPHIEPSAVAHLPQQIRMIEQLIERGHAYASDDGSVYFAIASFPEYGELSGLDKRELDLGKTQNERANADEYEKASLADFVLWKARRDSDGENYWESPWGQGRPGWHLECSAMIREYLGDSFDLHSGGVDLVFPHHENEIAQSRCACGGDFARHWFHVTHLMVDGAKMSKSLGNLYTLEDLRNQGYSAAEVRFVLLAGHYRKQLNFTFDSLRDARLNLRRIREAVEALEQIVGHRMLNYIELMELKGDLPLGPFAESWQALLRDLNAPLALGNFFSQLAPLEKAVKASTLNAEEARNALHGLSVIVAAFAWDLDSVESDVSPIPSDIQEMAERRWQAKQNRDWALSDQLRDELLSLGWLIKDGKDTYAIEATER